LIVDRKKEKSNAETLSALRFAEKEKRVHHRGHGGHRDKEKVRS
jgi:hypothetical protein